MVHSSSTAQNANGLRALRTERGWSQEHLATLSGLSERTIQRIERSSETGTRPSLDTLQALAAAFDVSPAQMRDLMDPTTEADMPTPTPTASHTTPDTPAQPPLFSRAAQRLLIGGAVYLGVMTWLAMMQVFAGWDPELLPYVALTGGGLLATYAFYTLGGDKTDTDD
ncbi:helix-turn-helix domain-containing protein [Maricaulis sp. D1M11]|uniref:helix-turn-helix domain-containing protein n=1 Tax=Maricaulis sp. D1M11 TaxID=3076117 RepID=UPI0039B5722F